VNKPQIIENEFRNFELELIAGEEDYIVTTVEYGLKFKFDFSKVGPTYGLNVGTSVMKKLPCHYYNGNNRFKRQSQLAENCFVLCCVKSHVGMRRSEYTFDYSHKLLMMIRKSLKYKRRRAYLALCVSNNVYKYFIAMFRQHHFTLCGLNQWMTLAHVIWSSFFKTVFTLRCFNEF